MSYIITTGRNPELVAETDQHYPSGMRLRWAFARSAESIDASREWNLVNANNGVISNAKRWERIARESDPASVTEINPGEFYIR